MRLFLLFASLLSAASSLASAGTEYEIDPTRSEIRVHVGKSGLFKFAGHEHEIVAAPASGRVVADPAALASSTVSVRVETAALHVKPETDVDDAAEIQQHMQEEVLEIAKYVAVVFTSEHVSGRESKPGHYALDVAGRLELHGLSGTLKIPVEVAVDGPALTATGHFTITHDAFGLKRISVGGGAVKVANDIGIDFTFVAHAK